MVSCHSLRLLTLSWLLSGCAATVATLGIRDGLQEIPPKVTVHEIRQHRIGLSRGDGITVIVDTLEGEFSAHLEDQVYACVRDSFLQSNFFAGRVVPPDEFRGAVFPGLSADKVLDEPWDQRFNETAFRQRLGATRLNYLIVVTFSAGNSLPELKNTQWSWHRFSVIAAKVVDLEKSHVAGKLTASLRHVSRANERPGSFEKISSVDPRICETFANELLKFLIREDQPPKLIMSSLTLDNLFPQRQVSRDTVLPNPLSTRESRISKPWVLGPGETHQVSAQKNISDSDKPQNREIDEAVNSNKWDEIRPLIKARKELVVDEDHRTRWIPESVGFRGGFDENLCREIKSSLNTITLRTKELPPLPSAWHLIPVVIGKFISLPIQLALAFRTSRTDFPTMLFGPATVFIGPPDLLDPANPFGLTRGIKTLYECYKPRGIDIEAALPSRAARDTGHANNTTIPPAQASGSHSSPLSTDGSEGLEIHRAAEIGALEKVRMLIKERPDWVNARNKADLTPLHLAASYGHVKVVEFLLSNQADPNLKDWQGATPLVLSTIRGHRDIAHLLRTHGARDD